MRTGHRRRVCRLDYLVGVQMTWQPISTAPKDGALVRGRGVITVRVKQMPASILPGWKRRRVTRLTRWGKTSHVPLYGWNYGRDVEDMNLWEPEEWQPLPEPPTE